jgi:ornithine carbamoyltransferase
MIFAKSSTRTACLVRGRHGATRRVGMFLSPRDTQLGRGEPIEDTARVLSRMVDAVMIRTFDHADVETFAAYSSVPVINGLTDLCHPCQLLADMQTYFEHRGRHPRAHRRLGRRRQQHVPLLHRRRDAT